MTRAQSTAFLPSSAFHFRNAFANEPVIRLLGRWPIGCAGNGFCGGMMFAARLARGNAAVPPDETAPQAGSVPFRFQVRRLIAALTCRSPVLGPGVDGEAQSSRRARSARNGRRIRASIDAGRPCPIGLVTREVGIRATSAPKRTTMNLTAITPTMPRSGRRPFVQRTPIRVLLTDGLDRLGEGVRVRVERLLHLQCHMCRSAVEFLASIHCL